MYSKVVTVKLDKLGLKRDSTIYLEPIGTYHVGNFDKDIVEKQLAVWKELHKNCDGKGILSDKRWSNNV